MSIIKRYQKYIKKLNSLPAFVKYRLLKLTPFFSPQIHDMIPGEAGKWEGRRADWITPRPR